MTNKIWFIRILSSVLAVSLLLFGCSQIPVNESGAMREETHAVETDTAASVKVDIEMSQGLLKISNSSAKLMEGTFRYNVTEWKPQVVYESNGSQGTLLINQPDSKKISSLVKNGQNEWELHLGEAIPLDLNIAVGAGESNIDLTQIDLTNLAIDTGAGGLVLDLRGQWTHDINIAIRGGIGDVILHLPQEIGVRVEVKSGLGNVNRVGMTKDGDAFVNAAFGKSPNTLSIRIETGTGSVNLQG